MWFEIEFIYEGLMICFDKVQDFFIIFMNCFIFFDSRWGEIMFG